MANRTFREIQASKREVKVLYFKFTIASGAATLATDHNGFVTSFAKQATGKYDCVLRDKYNEILSVHVTTVQGAAHDGAWHLHTDLASGNAFSLGHTDFETPALTDPADATYKVEIHLKNSSVR